MTHKLYRDMTPSEQLESVVQNGVGNSVEAARWALNEIARLKKQVVEARWLVNNSIGLAFNGIDPEAKREYADRQELWVEETKQ